ncbi:MAG: tRNA (guanosine(37)-N1)-methyltransferase TrmD [Rhodocyclales bacterium]|nr:tRNA (guanosine(37)-N1)-methyltransferase TrmD [Rhodocyclales bacterium]
MRRYDVVTIFPAMFAALTEHGVTRRARERGLYELALHDPRDFTDDPHRRVDDRPYGGGPGMLMRPEPLTAALRHAREQQRRAAGAPGPVIYLSPQGRRLDHAEVMRLAARPAFILLCGRYEGIDQRVIEAEVDEELSIGDFVLSGGELAAMVVLDAVIRQLPGALGDAQSAEADSYVGGLLDHPHYTRPEVFAGRAVPEVLRSGDHEAIERWRIKERLRRTRALRPDLLAARPLSVLESRLLEELEQEESRDASA